MGRRPRLGFGRRPFYFGRDTDSYGEEQAVRTSCLAIAVLLALGTHFMTVAARGATGWKVVKSRSISGLFAVTATTATVSARGGSRTRMPSRADGFEPSLYPIPALGQAA